jgi:hypothetical protein
MCAGTTPISSFACTGVMEGSRCDAGGGSIGVCMLTQPGSTRCRCEAGVNTEPSIGGY